MLKMCQHMFSLMSQIQWIFLIMDYAIDIIYGSKMFSRTLVGFYMELNCYMF